MAIQNQVSRDAATPKRKGLTDGVRPNSRSSHPSSRVTSRWSAKRLRRAPPIPAIAAVQQVGILHEARFVVVDDGKRVLFASSFDGSWDDYIDDFFATYIREIFDNIWSHCEGYPGTGDPSVRDWFMKYAVEASAYLSSYPNATTQDIWQALAVQKAFQQVLDNPAAERALQDPAMGRCSTSRRGRGHRRGAVYGAWAGRKKVSPAVSRRATSSTHPEHQEPQHRGRSWHVRLSTRCHSTRMGLRAGATAAGRAALRRDV